MSEELKGCPFCGGKAKLYTPRMLKVFWPKKANRYIIDCSNERCFCSMESLKLLFGCKDWADDAKKELIEMWNKRV